WTGPDGFTSNEQNPQIPDVTNAASGTYTLEITDENGCSNTSNTELVVTPGINAAVLSNGPLCEGESLQLSETSGAATSWLWTGPNGFTSDLQNPEISVASTSSAGTYSVQISDGNCTATAQLEVMIYPFPPINITTNAPIVIGANLIIEEIGGNAVSWLWEGPDAFSSDVSSVSVTNATEENAGTYSVTISDVNGCVNTDSVVVEVLNVPLLISGDTSLCEGESLQLTETGGNAESWTWSGPDGFTSPESSISISGITAAQAGTYSVTITYGTNTVSASVNVIVNELPSVSINASEEICEGDPLTLTENGGEASSWQWTGPAGFSSTEQNATITDVTPSNAGNYSVIISGTNGCPRETAVEVIVNPTPDILIDSNGPLCEGDTLALTETGGEAVSWSWTGPDGFTSNEQNPQIPDVTNAASGTYTLEITDENGCSNTSNTELVV
ncbi:MAG: hypothetical protein GY752_10240, partial [bacterium]|nr:hypothetical protein [bacterium]